MSVEIRSIRADDVYLLEELQVDPGENPFEFEKVPFEKWEHNRFIQAMNCKRESVLVAFIGKSIVGYVAYRKVTNRLTDIEMIAVDSFFRRRGVGMALLHDVFCDAYASVYQPKLRIFAPDSLLDLHKLLSRSGMKAVRVEKDKYVFEGLSPVMCGA